MIPELIEALLDKAAEMTKAIADNAGEVEALTKAMDSLTGQPPEVPLRKLTAEPRKGAEPPQR